MIDKFTARWAVEAAQWQLYHEKWNDVCVYQIRNYEDNNNTNIKSRFNTQKATKGLKSKWDENRTEQHQVNQLTVAPNVDGKKSYIRKKSSNDEEDAVSARYNRKFICLKNDSYIYQHQQCFGLPVILIFTLSSVCFFLSNSLRNSLTVS